MYVYPHQPGEFENDDGSFGEGDNDSCFRSARHITYTLRADFDKPDCTLKTNIVDYIPGEILYIVRRESMFDWEIEKLMKSCIL